MKYCIFSGGFVYNPWIYKSSRKSARGGTAPRALSCASPPERTALGKTAYDLQKHAPVCVLRNFRRLLFRCGGRRRAETAVSLRRAAPESAQHCRGEQAALLFGHPQDRAPARRTARRRAGGHLRQSRLPHIRNIPMKCILEKLIKSIISYEKRLLELIRQPFMLLLCPQKFYMKKRTFKFMHKRLENACFLSQNCPQ